MWHSNKTFILKCWAIKWVITLGNRDEEKDDIINKKTGLISTCSVMCLLYSPGQSTWSLRRMWRWKESQPTASLHHALFWPAKRRTRLMRVSASAQKSAWEPAFWKSVPVGKVNVNSPSVFSHPHFSLSHAVLMTAPTNYWCLLLVQHFPILLSSTPLIICV